MDTTPLVLRSWNRLSKLPLGAALFTRAISLKAPYFLSIPARFVELSAGHAVVTLRKRRSITNHLGGVHAIALCNLAELAGGIMTEASVPTTHRWIPKRMSVEYLKRADGLLRAQARFGRTPVYGSEGFELPAECEVTDATGEAVFRATITMWVSPRKPR